MNIRAALLEEVPGWMELLEMEGFPWVQADVASLSPDQASVLIVNRELTAPEAKKAKQYLRGGGGIVGVAGFLTPVTGIHTRRAKANWLLPELSGFAAGGWLCDTGGSLTIPAEAHCLRTETGEEAVFAGRWEGGAVVALPFDPGGLLNDERSSYRSFYSGCNRLPSERVSLVGKGELVFLWRRALEFVHHLRDLPYAHVWYYPEGEDSVFAFRVDTDGAHKEEIVRLRDIAHRYGIPVTWFLDVKSHESWLVDFRGFTDDELALHCYHHRISDDNAENEENISTGLKTLRDAGIHPVGFSSPFGIWKRGIAEVTERNGLLYSSEFSFAYDAFPFFPAPDGRLSRVIQVPIHPVCIGSMLRVGYDEEAMTRYFRQVADRILARNEPLVFYHHPGHHGWDVLEALFASIARRGVRRMTFSQFSYWWKQRRHCRARFEVEGENLSLNHDGLQGEHWVEVTRAGGRFLRRPLAGETLNLSREEFGIRPSGPPFPADLRRMREFDARTAVANLYNELRRKMQ